MSARDATGQNARVHPRNANFHPRDADFQPRNADFQPRNADFQSAVPQTFSLPRVARDHRSTSTLTLPPAALTAFSLIELLVTIGIIGILAAMLMPAISRAKGKANDVNCISNLRQIGIALSIYADENQGRLPYAERRPTTPVDPKHVLPRIVDVLSNHLGGAVAVFKCPRDRFGWYKREGSSYEWNYQANGQPIVLPGIISGIKMTAEKARLMYDYENFHPGSTNGTKNVLHGDGHVAPIR